jgi:hypothetical protein
MFMAVDCPVCGRYAPEIGRLAADFVPKGIGFWLIYPNADESAAAIRKNAQDFKLELNALRDPEHALVRRAKAKVTPQAAVFLPDGRLVYSGRIDDRQVVFGRARSEPTERDLENVLRAVLRSEPIVTEWKAAVGCSIPDL